MYYHHNTATIAIHITTLTIIATIMNNAINSAAHLPTITHRYHHCP